MSRSRGRFVPLHVLPAHTKAVSAADVLMNPEKHLEPLTDELITELVAAGWEHSVLLEARAMGLLYARSRDSFFTAPEYTSTK